MTRRGRHADTPSGRALAIVEAFEAVAGPAGFDYDAALQLLEHPIAAEAEVAWLNLGRLTGVTITDPVRQLVLSTLRTRRNIFGRITHPDIPPPDTLPTIADDVFVGLPRS